MIVRQRLNYWLESRHPNLPREGYRVTSRRDKKYNCVALAAEDDKWWWEPIDEPGCRWPRNKVPMIDALENYVKVFQVLGYTICADSSPEVGFEKVAIYQDDNGSFTHVARQLSTGLWLSKLGPYEDVQHQTPEALKDDDYGFPAIYLRRRITFWIKMRRRIKSFWYKSES